MAVVSREYLNLLFDGYSGVIISICDFVIGD